VSSSSVRIVVNGATYEIRPEPQQRLLSVLRDDLGLTGVKPGCGEGGCGACTVLIDGEAVRSCQIHAADIAGRTITTVEGLEQKGILHPVQRGFLEETAMQCGYCTPGMILSAVALLAANPRPDEEETMRALEGNVCRCGTYVRILRAVQRAVELLADDAAPSLEERIPPDVGELPAPRRGPWDLVDPVERDYFAVLSDGLVVVLPEESSGGAGWSTTNGCWIHVGADGIVSAFTGKVDVGQDNRTALSLLVAEELRVPIASIRLVMGDTDLCPFDMGTFSSRSIPDAGRDLRVVAAAAREILLASAAKAWKVETGGLTAFDGRISEQGGGRSIAYEELLTGVQRREIAARAPAEPDAIRSTANRPTSKVSGRQVVTGAKRFPSDVTRPGMLVGRVLRPPAPGARLREVRFAEQAAMPEVTVVQDGDFLGVSAPSASVADLALGAIQTEWDLAPREGEIELIERLRASSSGRPDERGWGGPFSEETGDVDAALEAADIRLAQTYTTAYIAHAPLETRAAVAEWTEDRLTVWTGTQRPFGVRSELADALAIREEQVRVIVPDTGGAYGGKHTGEAAVEAARLARASGRPVCVKWSREEEFTWAYVRPAAVIDVRSGATAGGTLTAWEFTTINAGDAGIRCPYLIPDQRIASLSADSPLRQGSYRALAATANHFARESHIDELADRIGMDPLELRLRHLRDDRLAEVFGAAAERAGWDPGSRVEGGGLGIAGGVEKDARVATCVQVRAGSQGNVKVERIVTAFECGAIVDPDGLRNQIEGATVMGLGGALFESIRADDGRPLERSFSGYRVPRFSDVPPIEILLLDRRDLPSAGAGETPIVAVAPAIANAIFAATGRRIRSMPLTPDREG
jgi:nicotinate dehydrogenase subunit B